jgi:phosphate transport system permease protein
MLYSADSEPAVLALLIEEKPEDSPVTPLADAGYMPLSTRPSKMRRWRGLKDGFSRYFVGAGGISVIIALALIFLYLFYEVAPLLRPASIEPSAEYAVPGPEDACTLHVAMERYREVAVRFADDGSVTFFEPKSGTIKETFRLPIPEGATITSVGAAEPRTQLLAFGLSDGQVIIVKHEYDLKFSDDVRLVMPKLSYPFGEKPMPGDPKGQSIRAIGAQQSHDGSAAVVIATDDGRLRLIRFSVRKTLFASEVTQQAAELDAPGNPISQLMLSIDMGDLIVGDEQGYVHYYDVSRIEVARLIDSQRVVRSSPSANESVRVTALQYLLGTVSIIVGTSEGDVTQWMLVRDKENVRHLREIRSFEPHQGAVVSIQPENARKGFVTADDTGTVALHFSTSEQTLVSKRVSDGPIRIAMPAPRANALLVLDSTERLYYLDVHNPHPQASFSALWRRVWYEGYDSLQFRWESSSATDEFEPKLSLVPLTVGTIKAAFYAMLFAAPLAVMGAIYSAYFMTPRMRGFVKPSIEIMEALPTVILGFLAGLWFAPFVENHLPAVFSVLVALPLGVLLVAYLWSRMPASWRTSVPEGWEAALLIPVILLIGWMCVSLSPVIETWFFDGDMRQWFTDVGITYDQRNALVVGVAMGFAVIPTIFSITDDAIFNVPRHLTQGSLALGATPWQTMVRVVLLTASPGIFSAVMIGLGRAVGETMIVLMATGNSPVTNFNIFEGMRTLSANIAVEMPETEVGGTHFRVLFLSALVLFVLTFVFNTVAELIRQHLRKKYASI